MGEHESLVRAVASARTDENKVVSLHEHAQRAGEREPNGRAAGSAERTAVMLVRFPLWSAALRGIAESSDIRVVGSAADDAAAQELLTSHRPEAFIVALDDHDGIGLGAVRMARELDPELRVIVLSKDQSRTAIAEAFEAGANIYLLIDAHPDDLVAGMKQLFSRSVFIASDWSLPNQLHDPMLLNGSAATLTRRELEILRLVAEGHTNNSMASMLWVTEQTIKFHLTNIYRKLDVRNRTEASRWAQLNGLLSLGHVAPIVDDE